MPSCSSLRLCLEVVSESSDSRILSLESNVASLGEKTCGGAAVVEKEEQIPMWQSCYIFLVSCCFSLKPLQSSCDFTDFAVFWLSLN